MNYVIIVTLFLFRYAEIKMVQLWRIIIYLLLTIPVHLVCFSGVRVTHSSFFYVDHCLSFFFLPLNCLSFFDLRLLIAPFGFFKFFLILSMLSRKWTKLIYILPIDKITMFVDYVPNVDNKLFTCSQGTIKDTWQFCRNAFINDCCHVI